MKIKYLSYKKQNTCEKTIVKILDVEQGFFLDKWLSYDWFWLWFFVPLENFSFKWRLYWWRAANVDLCSALMALGQWGFFSVPHLLWHGASVYNGHLRGPVTLTPIAERLVVELCLPFYRLRSVATGDRTPISRKWCERSSFEPMRRFNFSEVLTQF